MSEIERKGQKPREEDLAAENKRLRAALEEARRWQKRQAAQQQGYDFLQAAQQLLRSPQPLMLPIVEATARAP